MKLRDAPTQDLEHQVDGWEASRRSVGTAPDLPPTIPSLNGFRAVSIVLVFIAHSAGTRNAPEFIFQLVQIGNLGVKVFFVISGFLITTLLLREWHKTGGVSLRNFYTRRVLRIFPALYTYLAVIIGLYLLGFVPLPKKDLIHALTFTMNYGDHSFTLNFDSRSEWYLNHLWSLSVEEQFYLLWPISFFFAGPRRGAWLVASTIVVVPFIRLLMVCVWPELPPAAYTRQFQCVADSLATGCLWALCFNWLGTLRYYRALVSSRWFLALFVAGMLVALLMFKVGKEYYYVIGQSMVNVLIVLAIDRYLRFPNTVTGRILNNPVVQFVGVLSYSLYLWQEPFLNIFDQTNLLASFPINVGLSVLAGLASYGLVERQFLRLKQRFSRSRI
jgi:peptidoglycan/LPS O-acetylase OafA/YrhL